MLWVRFRLKIAAGKKAGETAALGLRTNRLLMMLASWSPAAINAVTASSALIAFYLRVKRGRGTVPAASPTKLQVEAAQANVEYLRLMYATTRQWYTASETKAQLLLAVNGVFVTVLFGILFGRSTGGRTGVGHLTLDTWVLIAVSAGALVGAIACASLCLWSLHGRAQREFAQLGVDPGKPSSYRPEVLWYFGHLAQLQPDAVKAKLHSVDRSFEIETLSYHVVDLAHKVLRKHRWVNAGWAFTTVALIALVAAGISFFV
jgi:hypothetical protein